jgi:hypothetical protein
MSATKKVAATVGQAMAPKVVGYAPGITAAVIRQSLVRGIEGAGPLPPAAHAARKQLEEQNGNVDKAIRELIENHVRYAGAGGFLTNLGGLVTAVVTAPGNIAGLAIIQTRMVAGIAHLRGYDLDDPRVRNAVLLTLIGEERINQDVADGRLPAPPMAIATAPVHDARLDQDIAVQVAEELVARVVGKRMAATVGRRIPVVGGFVGAGTDGFGTWKVGRYAKKELLSRRVAG